MKSKTSSNLFYAGGFRGPKVSLSPDTLLEVERMFEKLGIDESGSSLLALMAPRIDNPPGVHEIGWHQEQ